MAKLSFYHQYFKNLTNTVKKLDLKLIDKTTSIIIDAIENKKIFLLQEMEVQVLLQTICYVTSTKALK